MSKLTDFYEDKVPYPNGTLLRKILGWEGKKLEHTHDYIQWLFPLSVQSRYNPNAPLLTLEDMLYMANNEQCQCNLIWSVDLMLDFYGGVMLNVDDERKYDVFNSRKYNTKAQTWQRPNNHNHLRLTRMMESLTQLGQPHAAVAIGRWLESIIRIYPYRFTQDTAVFWGKAITKAKVEI